MLAAGDTVTILKDLNVKGAGFTAKRGTVVRRISLVADNPEHIKARVNGQQIVILTKFIKKSNGYKLMNELKLFTDGSVNTHSKIGYGAYLAVYEQGISLDLLQPLVKVRRFERTSSTKLELQTLLWALDDIQAIGRRVIVYTDSQNIMGLPGRRVRFVKNDYRSKKNKRLNNYKLYQEFYKMIDPLDCDFVKVRGHQVSKKKDDIARIFTLVDRASRNALREDIRPSIT